MSVHSQYLLYEIICTTHWITDLWNGLYELPPVSVWIVVRLPVPMYVRLPVPGPSNKISDGMFLHPSVHLCISFIIPYRYLTYCTLNNGRGLWNGLYGLPPVRGFELAAVSPSVRLSVRPPVRMTVCPSNRTSDSVSVLPSVWLSVRSPFLCQYVRLTVHPTVGPSFRSLVCLHVHLSVCPSIRPYDGMYTE